MRSVTAPSVPSPLPVPRTTCPSGSLPAPSLLTPRWFSKPVSGAFAEEVRRRRDQLGDRPPLAGFGGQVEQAEAVVVDAVESAEAGAEHLQAGADAEDHRLGRQGPPVLAQVGRGQGLRAVLAAAEQVEVQSGRHRLAEPDRHDLGVEPAPAQPPAQDLRVAGVAVGAEHLGQQESDVDDRVTHRAACPPGRGRRCSWRPARRRRAAARRSRRPGRARPSARPRRSRAARRGRRRARR